MTALLLFPGAGSSSDHPSLVAIAAAAFVAIFAFDLPFPAIVLAAGLIGQAGGRYAPARFRPAAATGPRRARPRRH